MKSIKHIFLFFSMLVGSALSSLAYPIVQVHMSNKGLFGYDINDWDDRPMVHPDNGRPIGVGWYGECHNPGFKRCRPPRSSNAEIDTTDDQIIDQLMTYVEDKLDADSKSGQHSVNVQVSGEPFLRVYKLSWNFDNNNDGKITIDRENV